MVFNSLTIISSCIKDPLVQEEFGRFRSFFWPVHRREVGKLLPMFSIFFILSFIYNLLRPVKQSIVLNAPGSAGAEIIPFLKVWAVLPMAFILTYIVTGLINKYCRERVFYFTIIGFLVYFFVFAVYLYPNLEYMQLHGFVDYLEGLFVEGSKIKLGLKGLFLMIRYWPLTIFYSLAELWGVVILTMLFWGFANEVTKVADAKRLYSFYSMSGNASGILAGTLGSFLASLFLSESEYSWINYLVEQGYILGNTDWEQALFSITMIVMVLGFFCMLIFNRLVNSEHLEETDFKKQYHINAEEDKLSLTECIAYVFRFRYLAYLAILVVSYNIIFHVNDVLWSQEMKRFFGDNKNAMTAYGAKVTAITGLFATLIDLFITGNMLRRFGWTFTALITPIVVFVTGIMFFSLLFCDNGLFNCKIFLHAFLNNPMFSTTLLFGTLQVISARSCKYTVFDASKEIAYIPLSKEGKRKGKAAIDVIGSRFGKSGGALFLQLMIIIFGSISASTPYIIIFIMVLTIIWIITAKALGREVEMVAEHKY